MLSQAVEDYLKAIYKLQAGGPASTTDLARALGVSSASVTNMVKRLDEMGLAHYESYKGVTLSPAGEKIALEIIRHHRLLELYLQEVMGYSWDQVHDEAEHLEHHISEEFEARIEEMLGFPTHDPHGDPIPTREGQIAEEASDPLSEAAGGQSVLICRVSDADPELLRYLERHGLMPGTRLDVIDRAPFNGPVTVRLDGAEQVIGHQVASNIFVAPAPVS